MATKEELRVLGVIKTEAEMEVILETLHQRGYKHSDIKLVANHPLEHKLRSEADTYEQDDVDPTDDNDLGPDEKNGIFFHFFDVEKDEHKKAGSWFSQLLDKFTYGDYLTDDQAMLIRDHQSDIDAGYIVVMLNDQHVSPDNRYYLE